jgi:hypothetical protein
MSHDRKVNARPVDVNVPLVSVFLRGLNVAHDVTASARRSGAMSRAAAGRAAPLGKGARLSTEVLGAGALDFTVVSA